MRRKLPLTHIALFAATFLTTLGAGALHQGVDPLSEPGRILEGLPFSFTLMLILLSHELSHYIASRAHHTHATLPYFIPAPSIIGTFGAFIKMKSPIITRKALIDIGASGPIVGFVISVAACVVGLSQSQVVSVTGQEQYALSLGDSLLFLGLSKLLLNVPPEGHDVLLHPVAFAGWIGLFVTSLNLLPIGQLDGGHISYAFLGEVHRKVSTGLVFVLAVMGLFWAGWTLWALLMVILGLGHPPVQRWEVPLDGRRKLIGGLSLVVFVITFTPRPFTLWG
ncbi:MAG: site-2 protease family protein [Thermodesulfovibrionales bacterium]